MTALGDATFTWDRFGHLQSATQARGGDTDTYGFGYDASFRRFQQTKTNAGGTTWEYYAYEGANIVAQLAPGPLRVVRSWLYDGVDHPLRMHEAGAANPVVYYEVDLAGNVRRLRAPGGADLGCYRYAAFGKAFGPDAKTPTPVVDQPLRWKGRWWNDFGGPDGTYDMRARVWSPELCVFLSADAFAYHDARGTLWSWPNQNPVNLSDPSGNCPTCMVGAVVGFWGAGLTYASTAPTNLSYGDFLSNAVTHMAWGAAAGAIAGTGLGGAILVTGALSVANENQIGMFAFPIFLGAAFQESCPSRGVPSARVEAEAHAAEIRAGVPKRRWPTATSAAVDQSTGKVYRSTSGSPPSAIHPQLESRMPNPSLEPWTPQNCAEFGACNAALQDGALLEDLEVHTVRTKSGAPYPRCRNCSVTTDGATVTSD